MAFQGTTGNLTFLNITWGREGQGHEAVFKSPFVLANVIIQT